MNITNITNIKKLTQFYRHETTINVFFKLINERIPLIFL